MVDDDLTLLSSLTEAALHAGRQACADAALLQQAGGNVARAFELAANQAVLDRLRQQKHPVLLLAEDAPPKRFGRGAPVARIIMRAVDGPEDFARGLPFSSFATFSIATAPPAGPLEVATVRSALLLPLDGVPATFVLAGGRAHTHRNGENEPLQVSNAERLQDSTLSVALDAHAPGRAMADLLGRARGVRAVGSCTAALLAVARGQLDAHVDVRACLTAESWLAAAAMVRAAGGVVMLLDEVLERADAPINLQQRRGLIATASRQLLEEILACLRQAFLPS